MWTWPIVDSATEITWVVSFNRAKTALSKTISEGLWPTSADHWQSLESCIGTASLSVPTLLGIWCVQWRATYGAANGCAIRIEYNNGVRLVTQSCSSRSRFCSNKVLQRCKANIDRSVYHITQTKHVLKKIQKNVYFKSQKIWKQDMGVPHHVDRPHYASHRHQQPQLK